MNLMLFTLTVGDQFDKIFYNFDLWVYSLFGAIQSDFMTMVAKIFTAFGDEMFVIPVAVLAVVLCLFKKTRKYGAALAFAILFGTLVTNLVLKPAVLRIRPYNTLQENADYFKWYLAAGSLSEGDYSFPSGHTTAAFELAVAAGICLRAAGKKKTSFIPLIIAIGVMCSRIYLMVHYPTDVIGGCIAGSLAGIGGYFAACASMKFIEKNKVLSKLNDGIDLEKYFKKKPAKKTVGTIIVVALVGFFCLSFIPALSEGGEDAIRCAYVGEYDCYNEAKVDDEDYPPIDGKCYCKIHWKQITAEQNGAAEAE